MEPQPAAPAPMPWLRKIRLAAALALFGALFLPLSRCARDDSARSAPTGKTGVQRLFPRDDERNSYRYAVDQLDFKNDALGGSLLVLVFTWPLPLLAACRKFPAARFTWLLHLLEVLLSAGSLWLLALMTSSDDQLLYGAYISFAAAGLYGATALFLLMSALRAAVRHRRRATAST